MTLYSFPATFSSVNGDLIYTVADLVKAADAVTYPDYRYVADIYIDTVFVTRLKAYPHPTTLMGIFNISNIVRNYVNTIFNPTASSLLAQRIGLDEWYCNVVVKFGEEYNFTLTTDIVVDASRHFHGHYNGRLIGQNTILGDYVNKPLTTRPYATPVYRDAENTFIPYFPQPAGGGELNQVQLTCSAYSENGSLLGSYTSSVISSTATLQMFILNVSPAVWNALSPGLINDNVFYYVVTFTTPDSVTYPFQRLRFDLKCEPRYEVFTIHFLNKLSGFESREFTKVSRKAISIEKTDFGKLPYEVNVSGVVSYYNSNKVYNETRSVYSSQYKEKIILNSDIMTDDEYTWLGELILSPLVYVEMDDYFIPCAIAQTDYEFKKVINDSRTNLTLNLEFGDQLNAQYR